jgi:hypothetical protein
MKYRRFELPDSPDNPFLWWKYPRKSIFQQDPHFRAGKEGRSLSQAATEYVEKARGEGKNAGYIKGVSRNREAEILRMRDFSIYSMPKVKK